MILHRHSKLIMGGGVCLLIALTGVVATASVATTQSTDTSSYIETCDTADHAVLSTATIDVATPTTAEPKYVDTVSKSTASEKTSSAPSKKTSSELSKEITSLPSKEAASDLSEEIILVTSEEIISVPSEETDSELSKEANSVPCKETVSELSQEVTPEPSKDEDTTSSVTSAPAWDGPVLNSFSGIVQGPSGSETYYNLDMSGVVSIMKSLGYDYNYWIRNDGVKMYGDYVMCAADLSTRPKGTIIETSLGLGIVCDTGGFVSVDATRLDIAVNW